MNVFKSITGATDDKTTSPLIWIIALLLIAFVAGCGGDGGRDSILGGVGSNLSGKAITAYSVNGVAGAINEPAKTISLTVPFGTPITALVANFTATGTHVKIGAVTQTSGTMPNNFTAPVTYRVTAADATFVDYVVTVTVTPALNSIKTITAFSFVGFSAAPGAINEAAHSIAVTLPTGTAITVLTANYSTVAPSVKIGAVVQASGGAPANNFTAPVTYRVTAADSTFVDYVVTVTVTPALSSIKTITTFSFVGFSGAPGVINEPAHTIAVTLPSGTAVTALIANYATVASSVKIGAVVQASGGAPANNFTAPVAYRVTAADATFSDYVVTVTVTPALNSIKTITAFSFVGFSGAPGIINEPAHTIAVTLPSGTVVTALTANFTALAPSVKIGAVVQTSGGVPTNDFTAPVTYRVTAADATFADYVVTVTPALSSIKTITAFSFVGFSGAPGVVTEPAHTIAVTLPSGTVVTALTANFTTVAPSAKIGAVVQTSGALPTNDFTVPVTYRVTAADATFADYVVTAIVTPALNSVKTITAFSFVGFPSALGVITEPAHTIAVLMPFGTSVTALTANYTTAASSVTIGAVIQTSGGIPTNDFTGPVTYTVMAADKSSVAYVVTVTVLPLNPTAPTLGEAGRFVIMANQAIATTSGSAISNGDIGITPAARTFITGLTPGVAGNFVELTGSTWAGMPSTSYAPADANPAPFPYPLAYASPHAAYATTGAMLTQASTDLGIATTFLSADPNPTAPTQACPTQLGTLTLTRGVYKAASDVLLTAGNLTLDAQGDPTSVFIFTITGNLTTGAPGGSITLINGAQARNVYFSTSGITTIAAGTTFYGNVFAWTKVAVNAGANITGSLYAVTDRVTLISDIVTKAP